MPRYKAVVEYNGTGFEGWQSQPNGNTIQQLIEKSFLDIQLDKIKIFGSGRTDSGVHALGQVFHFDHEQELDCKKTLLGLNHFLKKKNISILSLDTTNNNFDSRRDAKMRTYSYRILNRIASPAILENQVWHVTKNLDFKLMKQAADIFLGSHDFTTFRASSCEAASPIREIIYSDLKKNNDQIFYKVKSRSFLQHQVRSMVGAIKLVGENKWTLQDLEQALKSKDRNNCAPPAPSCGLYLECVDY
jgi:tRNA pseudouridine38-40 synthase